VQFGWLLLEAQSEYAMRDYTLRELRATDTRTGESRTVRQFQLLEWPEQQSATQPAPSVDALLDFLAQVRRDIYLTTS
jgi:hypothetical protein